MAGLSKLHDKCKKCEHKDKCNEKRMVACEIMELPFKINMGEHDTSNTSLEEVKKNIEKQLYCGFNISGGEING